jgi:glycerophosphoryl diester phosphodiesterase
MPRHPPARRPDGRPDTDTLGRIVAHRGASRMAPENTLAAFRLAAAQGARWIEFDVSLLGDDAPVVHHDATFERCTDASGPLIGLTATDLAGIDSGRWFGPGYAGEPVATLTQTLDLIETLGLSANLEIKPHKADPAPIALAVATALTARPWTRQRILVSSFDLGALAALRQRMPHQPVAVLYKDPPADWPATLDRIRALSLHIEHRFLTTDILATARARGDHVRVYTINDPPRMAQFRDAGLTGVITDHPPLFLDDPAWAAWAGE